MTHPTHGLDPNALEAARERAQAALDSARATGPNSTSQTALEYRLAECIDVLAALQKQEAMPVAWPEPRGWLMRSNAGVVEWVDRWHKDRRDRLLKHGYRALALWILPHASPQTVGVGVKGLRAHVTDVIREAFEEGYGCALGRSETPKEAERSIASIWPHSQAKAAYDAALSVVHLQNPGTSNTSGEAAPVAWRWRPVGVQFGDIWSVGSSPPNERSGWTVEPLYTIAALEPRASDRAAEANGLERAAKWHDQRARDTPDAFETEFHQVSAAIRKLSEVSQ